jgi:putative two-component system response regulator
MTRRCVEKTLPGGNSSVPGAFRDGESGLYNRDFFLACLERELTRSARYGDPVTVGILEVGRSGEAAWPLPQLGARVRGCIREVDLAARFGERLFALLLAKAPAELAWIVGERILKTLEVALGPRFTGNVGVASYPHDGSDVGTLLARADDALGRARDAGPNQVFWFKREVKPAEESRPRVLVVDDEQLNAKLFEAQLVPMGYEVIRAASGPEALAAAQRTEVDIVLLDVMMPGMSGYEVCRRLKAMETTRRVPVVMVTALEDLESKVKGIQAGADDFLTKPVSREELAARTRSLIHMHQLSRSLVSIENALFSLANAVEAKDNYTLGHTQRVASLAVALGGKLGLGEGDISALRLGGILHDVGKIGVPEAILNKDGKLDEDEWKLMRAHTELGYRICLPLVQSIGPALDVIRHHHEKLDGSSYPDGLKGEEISTIARVMSVVDIYDALVSDRPYRKAMAKDKACAILRQEAESGKIDGKVVTALEELVAGQEKERDGN